MNPMGLMRDLINGLCDIVYPKTCHVCKNKIAPGFAEEMVCPACWSKIKLNLPPFCRKCGRSFTGTGSFCGSCAGQVFYFDRAFSPCSYEGTIKELVRAFKYGNKDYLAKVLARPMIDFIREYGLPVKEVDVVIPVPLSAARLREREFNQALLLAKPVAEEFGKAVLENSLLRPGHSRSQTELDDEKRRRNVKGVFSIKDNRAVNGKNILLIDDVLTTGATLSEAAKELKSAGATTVYALTLAN